MLLAHTGSLSLAEQAEAPGPGVGCLADVGVASFLLRMLPSPPNLEEKADRTARGGGLLTPPLGPLPSAPARLRKGLVWAVRTGGPPAAATAAAAAAAAMRLVLPSEGATRAPAGSSGGADAAGSRPGVPADSSGVELPASRLAMGSWEPPAICSLCSSRFCWICWIIW